MGLKLVVHCIIVSVNVQIHITSSWPELSKKLFFIESLVNGRDGL